jgi:hypothetical protein
LLFFRQAKNKNSKGNHDQSGQVFPVLIIIIAALLMALPITRDIGESNIARTCSDNAADTGSLTSASCMTAAFNRTVYRNWDSNSLEQAVGLGHGGIHLGHPPFRITGYHEYYYYKEMRLYYNLMLGKYRPFYSGSNDYLTKADDYIDKALAKIAAAKGIVAGLPKLECLTGSMGPACGVLWMQLVTDVKPLLEDAADMVHEAALRVGAFNALAAYKGNGTACIEVREVKSETDPCGIETSSCEKEIECDTGPYVPQGLTYWFRENQAAHVCQAFGYLDKARQEGLKTAQQMSIQNSCYADKLTDAQRDDFNFWMGGGAGGSLEDGGTGGFNPCGDAHVSYSSGSCSIDVTLKIPTIDHYTMLKTNWGFPKDDGNRVRKSIPFATTCYDIKLLEIAEIHNDPFDYKASRRLVKDLMEIEAYLKVLAARCDTIYQLTLQGAACCCCSCGGSYSGCGSCEDCGECCKEGPADPVTGETDCLKVNSASCDYDTPYIEAEKQRQCLITNLGLVIEYLNKVVTLGGTNISIPSLRGWNNQIWANVWNGQGIKEATDCMSVTCGEADPSNVFFPGMMVMNIQDVQLSDESWQTDCKAVSSCGATSSSKSKFCGKGWPCGGKGSLLGSFQDNYEPEITFAD